MDSDEELGNFVTYSNYNHWTLTPSIGRHLCIEEDMLLALREIKSISEVADASAQVREDTENPTECIVLESDGPVYIL